MRRHFHLIGKVTAANICSFAGPQMTESQLQTAMAEATVGKLSWSMVGKVGEKRKVCSAAASLLLANSHFKKIQGCFESWSPHKLVIGKSEPGPNQTGMFSETSCNV
jgi:hypothetical protein